MRKVFFAYAVILLTVVFALGQNEQAPIVEKEISYKNWTYKSIRTGEDTNLRDLTAGKKLVIVVYFAPWCGNWKYDAPMLNRLYEKYKGNGLEIVGVGEYDPVANMKISLDTLKVAFPAVYESESRADRQKTRHFEYRRSTGDTRTSGSPWYIFLQPSLMEQKGDTLTKRTFVINGEMIEADGEKFIREKLGLPAIDAKSTTAKNGEIEICDPADKKTVELKKP
ncbi:MAG: TlpA disulfide reductase family protein [Pyrinomonadaceae bacterium]